MTFCLLLGFVSLLTNIFKTVMGEESHPSGDHNHELGGESKYMIQGQKQPQEP